MNTNDVENYMLACGMSTMPGQGGQMPNRVNGQQMSLKAFQNYVKQQKRVKGYQFSIAASTTTEVLSISGDAKMLLGFAFIESSDPTDAIPATGVTLVINNEVIVENVNPNFFSFSLTDNEFYFYPRPLNGRDQISLTIQGTASGEASFAIFYL